MLPHPKAITDCVTVGPVGQFAAGGSRALCWEGWVTVRLHRKRHFIGWLVRTDVQGSCNVPELMKSWTLGFLYSARTPDSAPLSDPAHHHTWHLEGCKCSLFPECRDNRMSIEGFSILATFENPKILVPKWMIFFRVTQGRTKQQQSSTVYSHSKVL